MNRLEEVKNELAAALNAWYLEKAEAITPAADFSQAYENGGDVAAWAAGLAGQIAEGAADFAGGTAASVKLTRGLQALAGRPVSGGHYISAEGLSLLIPLTKLTAISVPTCLNFWTASSRLYAAMV